jgi:hypothetical protein
MYTGTLIRDLMITVERAEARCELRQIADTRELERLYQLPVQAMESERALVGAA